MSERTREWLDTDEGMDARAKAAACNVTLKWGNLYMDVNDPEFRVCCSHCHDHFPDCLGGCGK